MASYYYPFFFFSFFFPSDPRLVIYPVSKHQNHHLLHILAVPFRGPSLESSTITPTLNTHVHYIHETSLHCSSPLFFLPGSSMLSNFCLMCPLSLLWKCPKPSHCLFVSKVLNLDHPSKNILVLISNPEDQDFAD